MTGKILLPTINGEAAARGGRVLFQDIDLPSAAKPQHIIAEQSKLQKKSGLKLHSARHILTLISCIEPKKEAIKRKSVSLRPFKFLKSVK